MALDYWIERFQSHPVWRWAESILELLNSAPVEYDPLLAASVDRLRQLSTQLKAARIRRVSTYDPASLEELDRALSVVHSGLVDWRNTESAGYLQTAADGPAGLAFRLLNSIVPSRDRVTQGTIEFARETAEASERAVRELRVSAEEIAARLTEIATSAEATNSGLQAEVDQAVSRIAAAEASLASQTARTDTALNDLATQFSAAQADRAAQAKVEQRELREDLLESSKTTSEQFSTQFEESLNSAIARLGQIEQLRLEAAKVVSAVGQTATATEYGAYAAEQSRSANSWRRFSITFFVLSSAVALFVVILWPIIWPTAQEQTWQLMVVKFSVTLGLLALGIFAARESSNHRAEERRAKSIQLDLAALDPFMANESTDSRASIKLKAARRLFVEGGPRGSWRVSRTKSDPVQARDDEQVEALTKIAEAILETVKKVK